MGSTIPSFTPDVVALLLVVNGHSVSALAVKCEVLSSHLELYCPE